jgi:molybdopterin adenylyltransferase
MSLQPLTGTILAVCLGPGGIPKLAVDEIHVRTGGIEGDKQRAWMHGGKKRAVCLYSIEDYRTLQQDGVKVQAPGAFGENVLCEGLDFTQLVAGDALALGDEVMLEIHDVREPCGTLKPIDARFPNLMLGRSGFVCKVLREGSVRPGMTIQRMEAAREPRSSV